MMSKGKILVVDDNSGIRAALKILLPKYFSAVELLASPAAKKHRIYRYEPHGLCRKIFRWLCILRRLCNNDRVFS